MQSKDLNIIQHPNTMQSSFLFLYDMFWLFIRPPSSRQYKYIKEKCAIKEAYPSQRTWYNAETFFLTLSYNSLDFSCKFNWIFTFLLFLYWELY